MAHYLGRRIFLSPAGDASDVDGDRDEQNEPLVAADDDADNGRKEVWFEMRLEERFAVTPTAYAMRHHSSQGRAPRNWKLLGAEGEGEEGWEVLKEHIGDETMAEESGGMGVWEVKVKEGKKYRRFRVLRTGPSAAGVNCRGFHVSGLELYGTLYVKRTVWVADEVSRF